MERESRIEQFIQTYLFLDVKRTDAMRRDLDALIDRHERLVQDHGPEKNENFRRDLVEVLFDLSGADETPESKTQPNVWVERVVRAIEPL